MGPVEVLPEGGRVTSGPIASNVVKLAFRRSVCALGNAQFSIAGAGVRARITLAQKPLGCWWHDG